MRPGLRPPIFPLPPLLRPRQHTRMGKDLSCLARLKLTLKNDILQSSNFGVWHFLAITARRKTSKWKLQRMISSNKWLLCNEPSHSLIISRSDFFPSFIERAVLNFRTQVNSCYLAICSLSLLNFSSRCSPYVPIGVSSLKFISLASILIITLMLPWSSLFTRSKSIRK